MARDANVEVGAVFEIDTEEVKSPLSFLGTPGVDRCEVSELRAESVLADPTAVGAWAPRDVWLHAPKSVSRDEADGRVVKAPELSV